MSDMNKTVDARALEALSAEIAAGVKAHNEAVGKLEAIEEQAATEFSVITIEDLEAKVEELRAEYSTATAAIQEEYAAIRAALDEIKAKKETGAA